MQDAIREKNELRAAVIARRDKLPADVRAAKSAEICRELERLLEQLEKADVPAGDAPAGNAAAGGAPAGSTAAASSPAESAAAENAPAEVSPSDDAPVVTVFSSMGSEVDLDAFVRAAWRRGVRVAFPCMVKNPAWRPDGADADMGVGASSAVSAGDVDGSAGANEDEAAGENDGASGETRSFVPRLLMRFRLVSRKQYDSGAVPFVVKPLRSFAPDTPELSPFPPVRPEQVDLAVCPLVAFDAAGGRLGYGGGNYDAFLARVRPDAVVVGVAFAEQEVPCGAIPREPHDLPLPRIVRA